MLLLKINDVQIFFSANRHFVNFQGRHKIHDYDHRKINISCISSNLGHQRAHSADPPMDLLGNRLRSARHSADSLRDDRRRCLHHHICIHPSLQEFRVRDRSNC